MNVCCDPERQKRLNPIDDCSKFQHVDVLSWMFPRKAMNFSPFLPPRWTERAERQRAGVVQRTQTLHLATCMILPSKHLLDDVDSCVCYDLVCPQREIIEKRGNRLMNRWHLVAVEDYREQICEHIRVDRVPNRRKGTFSSPSCRRRAQRWPRII